MKIQINKKTRNINIIKFHNLNNKKINKLEKLIKNCAFVI